MTSCAETSSSEEVYNLGGQGCLYSLVLDFSANYDKGWILL